MSGTERPMGDEQLDALLGEWLSDGVTSAPDRIAERAMLEVATTPQEGTRMAAMWSSASQAPLAWAAVPSWPSPSVLVSSLDRVSSPTNRHRAPARRRVPPPQPSPDGVEPSIGSETPVGTIEWNRTESERRIFPEHGIPRPGPRV